jgi:hypothetical protein
VRELFTRRFSHMIFFPTQRCPSCRSAQTKVNAEPGRALRGGIAVDSRILWTCEICKISFPPSNVHVSHPVLMCSTCRAPTIHEEIGKISSTYREPVLAPLDHRPLPAPPSSGSLGRAIWLENYRCSCGTTRAFGYADQSGGPS